MKTDEKKIILQVKGMTCANCAMGIKKQLEIKGLANVNVNFSTGEASCNLIDEYTRKKVEKIIKKLGYSVLLVGEERGLSKAEKYFYLTLLFTPLLFSHMFFSSESFLQNPILQFFLCLPVYFIGIRLSIIYSIVFCGVLLGAFWGSAIFPNFPEYSQIFAIKFLSSYVMVCLLSFSLEGLRFKASKRVERLAYQDSLTGLSNRLKLLQTLQGQGDRSYACVYIDLDDFSQINQLFGQKVSDKILQKFSENISVVVLDHSQSTYK